MKVGYSTFQEAGWRIQANVARLEYTLTEWARIRADYVEDPVRQHFHPLEVSMRKQFYSYPDQCRLLLETHQLTLKTMADFQPN